MAFDPDAIKANVDIVAVVGAHVALKKRGSEYVGLCVAHADKNPSMWVIPQKGFVHCFSCGFHADVIDFIQHMRGVDFKEACRILGAPETKWEPRAPIRHEAAASRPERITGKPPPDAGPPDFNVRKLGEPVATYAIRDASGDVLGYECRYEPEGGKKEIRVWTWGARGSTDPSWSMGHFNAPRPLYGLERLAEKPGAPISVFEGPKKADAGSRLLPQYACLSWTGGAGAWHKHDWSALAGRSILIWPDADEPGREAAEKLAAMLSDPDGLALRVKIVDVSGMPEGWDVADAEAEGWDNDRLIAWAKPRAMVCGPTPATVPQVPEEIPLEAYEEGSEEAPLPASMSDDYLADRFASRQSEKWRYVKPWGAWFEWRGDGWYKDEKGLIERLAVEITRQALYWPEGKMLTPAAQKQVNSRRTAGAVRDLAMTDRRLAAAVDQWDTDSWLLGVPGGVVNLRDGTLHKAKPEDYMTKRTRCEPSSAKPVLWLEFLKRATDGDEELLGYLRRFSGYSLTGETSEHALAFLYGTGANGKSTFLSTLSGILGDYAVSAGFEVFADNRNDRHPTEIARLRGARLVITEETDAGGRWNEGRVKRLTGGGKISAHFMRQDDFEFEPQFKLMIAGNHKPVIRAVDEAIKRRINVVPFTVTIPAAERDKGLVKKLEAEWPQILGWCIEGCSEWQEWSLNAPARVLSATDQYIEQEDTLGAWIDECCERSGTSEGKTLYENYRKWCDAQGEKAWSRKSWSSAMFDRGFQPHRTEFARGFSGIKLKLQGYDPASKYQS